MKIDIDRVAVVTPETNIGDLVLFHPQTAQILYDIGMHCLGCPTSGAETIEEAASVHGVDLETLVTLLNRKITEK
jgi:hybrid cluster-associated redox disulfide protein